MRRIGSSTPFYLLIALALTHTHAASTADTEEGHDDLDNVIVTASKVEKNINEMTHSVSVISEKQILEQGFTDLTEVLRQQAGVEFKQVGGVGQYNYLKLRGLASENVLVIVDGVKINTASGGNTRNLLSQLDPDTIESLEIVRGPQATLYGANSTAGVIVIRTKSGKHPEAKVGIEVGSLSWRKGDGSWRDNISLGGGTLVYAANVSATESDNIHEYEYFKDRSAQLKVNYEAQRWSVGGSYWQVNNEFGYAELDEASCCQTEASYWSFQTPDPNQFSGTGERIGSVHVEHTITDSLKHKLQVGDTRTTYSIHDRNDGLLGYQTARVAIPANSTGNASAIPAGSAVPVYDTTSDTAAFYRDSRTQAEYDLIYTGTRFNLLGGLEYEQQSASQWGTYGVSDTEDSQYSVFVNGDLKWFDERVIISLGVRADDYESWGRQDTGNVGFAWQLTPAWNVYANYGTSFKPATMSQLFNPTYGDSSLRPEEGRTVEVGVRGSWWHGTLSSEASYWNTKIDDVIFFDGSIVNPRRPSGSGQYNNGAEGKTSGVEFKAAYQWSSALSFDGNYTYTDSQTRSVGGQWQNTVQIAFNKANLGATYRLDRITLGTNLYYSGPRLRWAGDLQTAGYVRVDASARAQLNENLTLHARIENLLNDDYLDELGYAETGLYAIFGIEYRFF